MPETPEQPDPPHNEAGQAAEHFGITKTQATEPAEESNEEDQ
jgi:hypothetical protein